jgi:type IV secretion system protein VirB5
MFSKPAHAKPAPESPYLDARREYLERYGDHIQAGKIWRVFGLMSGVCAILAVGGLVTISGQSKVVPYVVQVDQMATVLPVGPADQAARPDSAIIRATLGQWVANTRTVYFDNQATRADIMKAYGHMESGSAAYQVVNDFMQQNSPFKRAESESVSVEVQSVLPVGGDTWRVEWSETRRGHDGSELGRQQWSGVLTTKIIPPSDEATILANPLGIYITALSWSPRI